MRLAPPPPPPTSRTLLAFAVAATVALTGGVAQAAGPIVVVWGAPDPSGADATLVRWAQRRGLAVVRELPASAEAPSAATALAAGRAAYRALRIDEAARSLDDAAVRAAESGGAGLARGDLVELAIVRAACRLARSDEAGAWDDLVAAAALAPDRPLDPAAWPPRLVAEARRAAQVLGPALPVEVAVSPPDALVVVDGEPLARGAGTAILRPGRHLVRAERPGFMPRGQAFVVAAGARVAIALTPAKAPTATAIVERAALAGDASGGALGAWIGGGDGDGSAVLHLLLVSATGIAREHGTIALAAGVSDGEIAAAAERLVPTPRPVPVVATAQLAPGEDAAVIARRRRARAWIIGGSVAGAVAAAALAVGLGVGLTANGGMGVHVDLRGAR